MASASAPTLACSVVGKRIAIMSYGSRGDMQPFVALGTRLQEEGASVLLVTNIDHLEFVSSFGLAVVATAGSCHDDLQSPEFLRGIATGDFGPYFARQYRQNAARMPERTRKEREAVEAFAPDLLYATPLTYQSACRLSSALGVPMALGSLFPAEAPLSNLGVRPFRAPEHPTFIHWSPELTKLQPWQAVSHRVTGFLVVGAQEDGRAQDHVFGGAEARRRLEAFLAAGEAPVYMGWGSMPVPRETASLAVRALKRAGLRGVVLGGWAKLDATMLAGQPDEEELLAYAAEHVIFVRNAPHEWLLPRCSVTVHHGGAGTVAAALRAGVPTVVTPCGLDQPENARVVEASGCGVALPQIASVTAEGLAAALERCAHDEEMRARSKAMAARLRSEDGLGCVVEEIAAYLEQKARESRGVAEARAQATALRLAARDFTRNVVARSPLAQHFAGVVAARRAARSVA
mmetsp:Transcript_117024/g.327472  ORF Transcript_117024/g.327472 Transcript_117024/m.327472 type:complete len:461 (-) Transcript_117024:20-1402(-)